MRILCGVKHRTAILLLVLAIVAAIGLYPWYYWLTSVYVTDVPSGDPIRERYYNILDIGDYFPGEKIKIEQPRNILLATGRFQRNGPNLHAVLYLVENGKITEAWSLTVGESPHRVGTFFGEHLKITFVLQDFQISQGIVTLLGSVGQTTSIGHGGPTLHNIIPKVSKVFRRLGFSIISSYRICRRQSTSQRVSINDCRRLCQSK